MSKLSLLAIAAFTFFLPFTVLANENSAGRELVFAADEWCPVNCNPGDAQRPGILVELLKAALEPAGYSVTYVTMPWDRAVEEAEQGRIAGALGAKPAEVPDLTMQANPPISVKTAFYVRKADAATLTKLEDIKGRKLGIISGYEYHADIDAILGENKDVTGGVQAVSGDDAVLQNMRKLAAGRIDVAIETEMVMDERLRTFAQANLITKLPFSFSEGRVGVAFSPRLSERNKLIKFLDQEIAKQYKSGALAALFARYGLSADDIAFP